MRKRRLSTLFLTACAVISIAGQRWIFENRTQDIILQPLTLNPSKPNLRKVGQLTFTHAWDISSFNEKFGGFSALTRLPDGRFIAVSDAGWLAGFTLENNIARNSFIVPMPEAYGQIRNFADRDSESIVYNPDSGRYWVGYEGKAAIRRFPPSFARSEAIIRPDAMQKWGGNSGAEAMVRLTDGRFIVFSEGHDLPDGSYEALLYSGDPTEPGSQMQSFGYRPPDGFKITDAALMPDGRVMTLNRRIAFPEGFSAAVAIFDPIDIQAGRTVQPAEIARLASPLLVDNMEGLMIEQDGNGQTILWMISDNNFAIWQRTLLMRFIFTPPSPKGATKKPVENNSPGFDALGG